MLGPIRVAMSRKSADSEVNSPICGAIDFDRISWRHYLSDLRSQTANADGKHSMEEGALQRRLLRAYGRDRA